MTFDFKKGKSSNYGKNNGLGLVFLHGCNLNLFTQKWFAHQQTYKYVASESEDTGLRPEIISAGTVTTNHQNRRTKSKMEASVTFLTVQFYQIAKMTRNPLIHDGRVQNRRKRTLSEL